MKDKIKLLFKTQKELTLRLSDKNGKPFDRNKLRRMIAREDKLLSEYLDVKIENIKLKSDLNVFEGYLHPSENRNGDGVKIALYPPNKATN